MKKPALCAMLLLMIPAGLAMAQDDAQQDKGFWYAQTSVYTKHYSPDPDHNNNQDLIGIERNEASGWVFGGATFRNSFSQRSNYAYAGKRFDSAQYPVYLKLTGGLLEGYSGKYQDKIPLNRFGVAPVIIPSIGTHYGPLAAELVLLGANAFMVTTGLRF
ncbi:sn-glycerol-3-phosphate transporter [Pseudomonas sp. TH41]|uniref:sn-glycerol-3-phosphate transporter n=1 Tax=Pseudomonas sp. TH41 TaxID=2796405 RepID=UPI001912DBCB|nr:sn-glycerol-3-phosphate transporter [Pseudomonas sp. TH41]MBK5353520.1 sn-glycerol-3-phosphate transporter [Pseudomonas sp. TH41]